MLGLGEAFSAVGLAITLWDKFKSARKWPEADKLVDIKWPDVAKEKGVLDPEITYVWRRPTEVERLLLEGKHDVVYALDKERKIKYRLTTGDLVLLGKKAPEQ